MSLLLQDSFCETSDCRSIIFYEETGLYNVSTNSTGWGVPNRALATVTAATLAITIPDGTIVTIDMFAEGFPTSNTETAFTINSYTLGLSPSTALVSLPDGLYKFVYTVTFEDETTQKTTTTALFSCIVKCGVSKLFANLQLCDCDCKDNQEWQNALFAWTMYQNLLNSAKCGTSTSNINNNLTGLQEFLSITNTTCGCLDSITTRNTNTI